MGLQYKPVESTKKWTKTRKVPPKNHIISSDVAQAGSSGGRKPFAPSYECEKRPDMWKLLTFDYQKQWLRERETSESHYRNMALADPDFLKRRIAVRASNHLTKHKHVPIIQLKRFANVLGKVDTNLGIQHSQLETDD